MHRPPSTPVQIDLTDLASANHPVYRYLLVIVDHFSKHVWLRPLRSKSSQAIAERVRMGCLVAWLPG